MLILQFYLICDYTVIGAKVRLGLAKKNSLVVLLYQAHRGDILLIIMLHSEWARLTEIKNSELCYCRRALTFRVLWTY